MNRRTPAAPKQSASKTATAKTAKARRTGEQVAPAKATTRAKPSTTGSAPAKASAQAPKATIQPAKATTQPAKATSQPATPAKRAGWTEVTPRGAESDPTQPARRVFYLPPTQAYSRTVEPPWSEKALTWLRSQLQSSKPAAGSLRNRLSTSAPAPGWLPKRLRQAVIVLLVFSICGFLLDGVKRVPHPYLLHLPQAAGASPLSSFGSAFLSVAPGPGLKAPKGALCALEASNLVQQQQGLMGVTNLGGYAGMVFVFDAPSRDRFYMKGTNIPLSIAWFGGAGHYLGSAVMPPCPVGVGCPTYGPASPFTVALEVEEGKLGSYGIGPGSTLHLGGSCTP